MKDFFPIHLSSTPFWPGDYHVLQWIMCSREANLSSVLPGWPDCLSFMGFYFTPARTVGASLRRTGISMTTTQKMPNSSMLWKLAEANVCGWDSGKCRRAERNFKDSASYPILWSPSPPGRFIFHIREVNELGLALEFHHMESRNKQVKRCGIDQY